MPSRTALCAVAVSLLNAAVDAAATASMAPAAPTTVVTVTPWCDNSARVRVQLADMPASTADAVMALERTLAAKNLTDLAGAMDNRPGGVAACIPGAPQVLVAGGAALTNGNLQVAVDSAGGVVVARVDGGGNPAAGALFTASASFAENANPASGAPLWTVAPNLDLQCTSAEYVDKIGTVKTADECLALLKVGACGVEYKSD
jgi:hypothetical protein